MSDKDELKLVKKNEFLLRVLITLTILSCLSTSITAVVVYMLIYG